MPHVPLHILSLLGNRVLVVLSGVVRDPEYFFKLLFFDHDRQGLLDVEVLQEDGHLSLEVSEGEFVVGSGEHESAVVQWVIELEKELELLYFFIAFQDLELVHFLGFIILLINRESYHVDLDLRIN